MSRVEPVDPRVHLAISQWPPDAPRGAVTTFCLEHGISRKTFCEIRKRVSAEGPAAVLEPRSRRPKASPTTVDDAIVQDTIRVRAALEQSGLDHGPISVHDRMRTLGLEPVPSTAALARIFRAAGVARLEPKKKPRASYRRFVLPSAERVLAARCDRVRALRRAESLSRRFRPRLLVPGPQLAGQSPPSQMPAHETLGHGVGSATRSS